MGRRWQLEEAKNRFSEVVEAARTKGGQTVTRRGKPVVAILSVEDYRELARPGSDLVAFFRNSPLRGVELDLERSGDLPR